MRRVQAALGALNLAEVIAHHRGQAALADRPPLGDSRRERTLGLGQPAAQPLGQGQIPAGYGRHHPLVFPYLGQGPRRERGRALGVAAERGEVSTLGGDRRGHVQQPASGPTVRFEGLIGRTRERALGGIQRRPGRLHAAAGEDQERLGQQQPWPRGD